MTVPARQSVQPGQAGCRPSRHIARFAATFNTQLPSRCQPGRFKVPIELADLFRAQRFDAPARRGDKPFEIVARLLRRCLIRLDRLRASSERTVEMAEIEPATSASASWEAGGSGLKPQALASEPRRLIGSWLALASRAKQPRECSRSSTPLRLRGDQAGLRSILPPRRKWFESDDFLP